LFPPKPFFSVSRRTGGRLLDSSLLLYLLSWRKRILNNRACKYPSSPNKEQKKKEKKKKKQKGKSNM